MRTQRLFINIYRSGHYHRQGKPGHCNIHGGDLFTSEKDALENAEPDNGYITTVPVDMPVAEGVTVLSNPEGSEPTPLPVTRRNPLLLMPWHTAKPEVPPILRQTCGIPLETADDPLGMSYEEWLANRQASGFHPLPAAQRPRVAALFSPPVVREEYDEMVGG